MQDEEEGCEPQQPTRKTIDRLRRLARLGVTHGEPVISMFRQLLDLIRFLNGDGPDW